MELQLDNGEYQVVFKDANLDVVIEESAPLNVVVGENARIEVGEAINYIKTGTAEIGEAVQEGISDFNANATEKTNAFNLNAQTKTAAYDTNADNRLSEYNSNADNKLEAFNNNAAAKTATFNDNYTEKKALIDAQVAIAEEQAQVATTQAQTATVEAGIATTKANEALTSASNARASEQNASSYAASASQSALNAAASETNASNSATAATNKANEAAGSATAAANSASLAQGYAGNAADSATTAAGILEDVRAELPAVRADIDAIEAKIPSAASSSNQLADKNYVDAQDNDLQSQIDAIVVSSDVFDVVGTYAELQAYDISTVPVNDIIKVLIDSTHSNAATYYRCVESEGIKSWSYIGSEGAYYTKAEADALLNTKQDTLVSGTNIKTINGESVLGGGDLAVTAQAAWGNITGKLSNQADLASALNAKADDDDVVHLAGEEAITGVKTIATGSQIAINIKSNKIDNTITPSTAQYTNRINFKDTNSVVMGRVFLGKNTAGNHLLAMQAVSDSSSYTLGCYSNGYLIFDGPVPAASDVSNRLTTTQFINNKFQVVSSLPASPTAGVFYFVKE